MKHDRCLDERGNLSAHALPSAADSTGCDIELELCSFVGRGIMSAGGATGTLGCLARTRHSGKTVFITASHVLLGREALEGQQVRLIEAGKPGRVIGRSMYGKAGNVGDGQNSHYIDCAVGSLTLGIETPDTFPPTTQLREFRLPRMGTFVRKEGAASGTTCGTITGIESVPMMAGAQSWVAERQILVRNVEPGRPFAAEGDSGALVRDEEGRAIGVLWSTCSTGEALVAPIDPILFALNISLLCEAEQRAFAEPQCVRSETLDCYEVK